MNQASVQVVCLASWNVDLIAEVEQPLSRGQTVMASSFERQPGGKGSNASIAATRQGVRVGVIARVGGDDFGQMGLDLWHQEGIHTEFVTRANGEPNGTALILVYPDGDNSIAVYSGAGAGLSADHTFAAASMIEQARVIMASCEVPMPAIRHAFELAKAHGVITVLNPAPAVHIEPSLWPWVDVLTPNRGELLALTGCQDLHQAAMALLDWGVGRVVVTLGEEGCACFAKGEANFTLKAFDVSVTDTIGAGDTFTGALAAALAKGMGWVASARHANAAAALSVTGRGAIGGMPTWAQTQALIAQQG